MSSNNYSGAPLHPHQLWSHPAWQSPFQTTNEPRSGLWTTATRVLPSFIALLFCIAGTTVLIYNLAQNQVVPKPILKGIAITFGVLIGLWLLAQTCLWIRHKIRAESSQAGSEYGLLGTCMGCCTHRVHVVDPIRPSPTVTAVDTESTRTGSTGTGNRPGPSHTGPEPPPSSPRPPPPSPPSDPPAPSPLPIDGGGQSSRVDTGVRLDPRNTPTVSVNPNKILTHHPEPGDLSSSTTQRHTSSESNGHAHVGYVHKHTHTRFRPFSQPGREFQNSPEMEEQSRRQTHPRTKRTLHRDRSPQMSTDNSSEEEEKRIRDAGRARLARDRRRDEHSSSSHQYQRGQSNHDGQRSRVV